MLNTQVNTPHSRGVSSLAFHPSEPLAVTTGADRKFRTWTVEQRAIAPTAPGATDADGDGVTVGQEAGASSSAAGAAWEWACRSVGFFRSEVRTVHVRVGSVDAGRFISPSRVGNPFPGPPFPDRRPRRPPFRRTGACLRLPAVA